MQIETIDIAGFGPAFKALRLPYDLEPRSMIEHFIEYKPTDREIHTLNKIKIDPQDMQLLSALIKRGDEHAKVLRGIIVYTQITAPIYWWWDLETYRVGHERLMSGSTMNKECKGLIGDALQKAKGEIPFGREITKIDYFSYQTLRRIYFQRKTHRLPEFTQFCNWIEELPFADRLITIQ